MTKPNPPQHLPASGTWTDFDENETPMQPDTTPTLALLTDMPGVNFVTEFVKQYAEQQGYSEQRTQALEKRAHDAIERWFNGREGHKLRLVNRIDGHPIDPPSSGGAYDAQNAYWWLTNADEFNAFLEALGETGRWHDPSEAPPQAETKGYELKLPSRQRVNVLSEVIDTAIKATVHELGFEQTNARAVTGRLLQMAEPVDGKEPAPPFTGRIMHNSIPIEFEYINEDGETATINRTKLNKRVDNRLRDIKARVQEKGIT